MKRLLLALLVSLGLQTQAQITCDSVTTTYLNITPNNIDVTTNSMSFGIPFSMHSWDLYEGGWNGQLTYSDTNVNASIPLPSPNLIDTFVLCNWSDFSTPPYVCYSCDTFAWNNGNWNLLSMIQPAEPYFCCDSITYWIDQSQGFNIGLDTSGLVHNPDSINVNWGVCTGFATTGMCYSGDGMYDYFPQITVYDTIKVAYDVYIYENGSVEVCSIEEWLVYDQGVYNWVLLNMLPTSINELTFNRVNDNKIYDLLGRELTEIPVGKLYIKNNKLYITNER